MNDEYGFSVSIWDDQALFGAPTHNRETGAAYLFRLSGSNEDLTGDYDGDGSVALSDLNLVLFNWNVNETELTTDWINQRPPVGGTVGLAKLNSVLFNWGAIAGEVALPEPAAICLALLATPWLIRMVRCMV